MTASGSTATKTKGRTNCHYAWPTTGFYFTFSYFGPLRFSKLGRPARIAELPDFALDDFVQFLNPGRQPFGICFPGDPLAEFDHLVAIFWGHGG